MFMVIRLLTTCITIFWNDKQYTRWFELYKFFILLYTSGHTKRVFKVSKTNSVNFQNG